MRNIEEILYRKLVSYFKNIKPGKNLLGENDNIKRIDLEDSVLYYNPDTGRLGKEDYQMPFFINKDTIGFGTSEKVLKDLIKELNKIG